MQKLLQQLLAVMALLQAVLPGNVTSFPTKEKNETVATEKYGSVTTTNLHAQNGSEVSDMLLFHRK